MSIIYLPIFVITMHFLKRTLFDYKWMLRFSLEHSSEYPINSTSPLRHTRKSVDKNDSSVYFQSTHKLFGWWWFFDHTSINIPTKKAYESTLPPIHSNCHVVPDDWDKVKIRSMKMCEIKILKLKSLRALAGGLDGDWFLLFLGWRSCVGIVITNMCCSQKHSIVKVAIFAITVVVRAINDAN